MGELISVTIEAGATGVLVLVALRLLLRRLASRGRRRFRVDFPRDLTPEAVASFLRSLDGLLPSVLQRVATQPAVVFETEGTVGGVFHALEVPASAADYVLGQARAAMPGVRFTVVDRPRRDRPDLARELRVSGRGRLRADASGETNSGLLAAFQPVQRGERLLLQWVVAPEPGGRALASRLGRLVAPSRPEDPEPVPQLAAVARVGVWSTSDRRARSLAGRVLGAFHALNGPEASFVRRLLPSVIVGRAVVDGRRPLLRFPSLLDPDELAAASTMPVGSPSVVGLALIGAPDLAAIPAVPRRGCVLGDARAGGSLRPVAIGERERLRGLYVVAPTGAGKSTALANLILQDVGAGRGVTVVESKGDLINEVLERIPAHRARDVIVFDPGDAERPLGFNLLAGEPAELVVDGVVEQFAALHKSYLGPRSTDLLRAALLTLATAEPGAYTLCEAPVLLADAAFRRRLVGRIDDHILASVWAWYDALSDAAQAEVAAPLGNKLRSYTLRRRLRRVIGQTDSPLDLDAALAQNKVLLVSLGKGAIGADATALLGSAILARLLSAIQRRGTMRASDRTPSFVYLDEAQDFVTPAFPLGDAVSQSRGYGVGWTVAHQATSQFPAELREACLANLRSKLLFQLPAADAARFARELAPHLKAEHLQALGPFEAYASVSAGNAVAPPASLTTRPAAPTTGLAQDIRRRSRNRYGRDAAEVERQLRERATGPRNAAPIQRRRRR